MQQAWAAGQGQVSASYGRLVPAWRAASPTVREEIVRQSLQPGESMLASGGCYFRTRGFSVSHHQGWVVVTDRRLLVFLATAGYTRFPGWMYFTGVLAGVLAYLVLIPGRPPRLVAEYRRVDVQGLWRAGGRWVGGGGDLLLRDGAKPLRFTRLRRGKSVEQALPGSPTPTFGA
jgi:hypothetical protein